MIFQKLEIKKRQQEEGGSGAGRNENIVFLELYLH